MHYPPIYHHRPPTMDPTYALKPPKIHVVPRLNAQWIWAAKVRDKQTLTFRGKCTLTSIPEDATCFITADDYFTLYINGKKIGETSVEPGNAFVWQQPRHYNIHQYLKRGVNTFTVVAKNDTGAAGLLCGVISGNRTLLTTDSSWKVHEGIDIPSEQSDAGSWVNATVEGTLMTTPWDGSLSGWPGLSANYLNKMNWYPHKYLQMEGIKPISLKDGILQVTNNSPSKHTVLIDFGQEVAGRILVSAPTGTNVLVGTGESIGEALNAPWGGVHNLTVHNGVQTTTPWSAFRYANVTFPSNTTVALKASVIAQLKYYPVNYLGSFRCSSPLLNKIWYTGAYTAHLCMQEDIWDAPKRDRVRWMGDLQVSGRVIDDVYLDKFLMEQTMTKLRDAAQDGRPPLENPVKHVNDVCGYSAAWVVGLADFTKRVGDLKYLNKQHDLLISMLRYMRTDLNSKDLFTDLTKTWNFVDWSPGFVQYSSLSRTATQMYYIRAYKDAAFLFNVMHDKVNARKCEVWAQKLTTAAKKYLLDGNTNTFSDRRQDNAMAVFAGVTTPTENSAIYQRDFQQDSPAWNQVATPYFNNYVLYAMSDMGHSNSALKFAKGYWGGMLDDGATTFWESYNPLWPKDHPHKAMQYSGSMCHGWAAGVTAWLTERVLGVESTGIGYARTTIAPDLCNLKWVKGDVPTPRGLIQVSITRSGGKETGYVIIPAGVTVDLKLNGHEQTVIGPSRFALPK